MKFIKNCRWEVEINVLRYPAVNECEKLRKKIILIFQKEKNH
jgi:hypothetical protein